MPRALTGRFLPGPTVPVAARFWSKVLFYCGPKDCWEWQGSVNDNGYGGFYYKGRRVKAHRVSWELSHNASPGTNVLHECDNPRCVRPSHLFLGSIMDNQRDMIAKGRMKEPPNATANRTKTHCPGGHEYSPVNTQVKRGRRHCRKCDNEYKRRLYWLRKEKASIAMKTPDEIAATELKLYIDNDGDLYRQQTSYILAALKRRVAKGEYDCDEAHEAFMHLVNRGARRYYKEFGSDGEWYGTFSMAARRAVATAMVDDFEAECLAPIPPCAASMGCLCAGHARGNDANAPCDTSEEP